MGRAGHNAILVLNAGSSSVKFCVFEIHPGDELRLRLKGDIQELAGAPTFRARDGSGAVAETRSWDRAIGHEGAVEFLLEWLKSQLQGDALAGVGHRVVHGGTHYAAPKRVTAALLEDLSTLIPLAPLHQPHNLLPARLLAERRPDLAQVACFDTAFHRLRPEVDQIYAIPREITGRGIRRYGFHGTSYEYIASVLPRYDERAAAGRTVVLHLGNGASMCAMRAGQSVATTMGFTPAEGLVMGTRCGLIDAGALLYLAEQPGSDWAELAALVNQRSGLLGVSGLSSDMRTLEMAGTAEAELAITLFCYRISQALGAMAGVLGGVDAIVFTAGIGENSTRIRREVCTAARWLGVELDESANNEHGPRISRADCRVPVWVIPTNEELMIARHTLRLLNGHN